MMTSKEIVDSLPSKVVKKFGINYYEGCIMFTKPVFIHFRSSTGICFTESFTEYAFRGEEGYVIIDRKDLKLSVGFYDIH